MVAAIIKRAHPAPLLKCLKERENAHERANVRERKGWVFGRKRAGAGRGGECRSLICTQHTRGGSKFLGSLSLDLWDAY